MIRRPIDPVLLMGAAMLSGPLMVLADPPADSGAGVEITDKPKVAIVQYESGRILVVREVNGELLVVQADDEASTALNQYMTSPFAGAAARSAVPRRRAGVAGDASAPLFFSPGWYGQAINTSGPGVPGTARARQGAAEKRQQVAARRREQGTVGVTNRAGQVYPSTAADAEEQARLSRVRSQAGGDPAGVLFYSLGDGLEHYRQQELAARKELALLTYDVLLDEGLRFFHERRYAQAARSFIAAADKDHGDAGSRLHAAQCLLATGLYRSALDHIRRACELAPQLLYRPINHRANYSNPGDFDRQVAALAEHVAEYPQDHDAVLLLAFEQFFSDDPAQAAAAMKSVKQRSEVDDFAQKLWAAARPVFGDAE